MVLDEAPKAIQPALEPQEIEAIQEFRDGFISHEQLGLIFQAIENGSSTAYEDVVGEPEPNKYDAIVEEHMAKHTGKISVCQDMREYDLRLGEYPNTYIGGRGIR